VPFVVPPDSRPLTSPDPAPGRPPARVALADIQNEEKKVRKSIKDCAKRNDIKSMRVLAKEVVSSRKTVSRLYQNKAQMNSVSMMLSEQLATVKSVGHLTKSTEVLKAMNALARNKAANDTMREMSKEMMKSGLVEELVEEAFEDMNGGAEDVEEESESELNKVLAEIAGESVALMPEAGKAPVPVVAAKKAREPAAPTPAEAEAEAEDDELGNLQARLDAIRQEAS
jgi:charged multivesicular body protein 3